MLVVSGPATVPSASPPEHQHQGACWVRLAGKSSLLAAILGEVQGVAGSVQVGGSVAYAPQHAWIMSASIRHDPNLRSREGGRSEACNQANLTLRDGPCLCP